MVNDFVLFSTIGRSDPIRGSYDGPFLHILRHYKPKKTYLFLTKEMWEYSELDNRYVKAAKSVSDDIEIFKIDASEIADAHDFLKFDQWFKSALDKIHLENPRNDILVNITSGTPQMQASLYVMSTTSKYKIRLIQVSTPVNQSNDSLPVMREYDIDYEIANNFDGNRELIGETQNRCTEIEARNVLKAVLSENIKSHILAYDYNAALKTYEQAGELFAEKLYSLLESAKFRISLDAKRAQIAANTIGYDLYPIKSGDVGPLFEYILYLNIKIKRNELAEFSRAVSPCLTHLFAGYLKKVLKTDVRTDYCRERGTGRYILELVRIPENYRKYYNEDFKNEYKDSELCAGNQLPLIKILCELNNRKTDKEFAIKLRDLEKNIRNSAAHNIVSVDRDTFLNQIKIEPEKAVDMIKNLFEKSYFDQKKSIQWDSYDKMNEDVLALLDS